MNDWISDDDSHAQARKIKEIFEILATRKSKWQRMIEMLCDDDVDNDILICGKEKCQSQTS